jgi:hypothetical protein
MKLHVEPMDAVVVEVADDGRVSFDGQDWAVPTLQERRAIIYAATNAIEELREWIERLQR